MLALFGLLLGALLLMSNATENSARFSRLYSWLLVLSAVGLFLLLILISYHLYRLFSQHRAQVPGSRLTLRLVGMFVVIAIAPVTVVYYFSLQFLQQGIDSWFDVRVEDALEDALELSQSSLDLRMREVLKQGERMAAELAGLDPNRVTLQIGYLLNSSEASEITVFSASGHIIAVANADPSVIVPDRPPEVVLMRVQQGHPYVSLEPVHG